MGGGELARIAQGGRREGGVEWIGRPAVGSVSAPTRRETEMRPPTLQVLPPFPQRSPPPRQPPQTKPPTCASTTELHLQDAKSLLLRRGSCGLNRANVRRTRQIHAGAKLIAHAPHLVGCLPSTRPGDFAPSPAKKIAMSGAEFAQNPKQEALVWKASTMLIASRRPSAAGPESSPPSHSAGHLPACHPAPSRQQTPVPVRSRLWRANQSSPLSYSRIQGQRTAVARLPRPSARKGQPREFASSPPCLPLTSAQLWAEGNGLGGREVIWTGQSGN